MSKQYTWWISSAILHNFCDHLFAHQAPFGKEVSCERLQGLNVFLYKTHTNNELHTSHANESTSLN